MKIAYICGHYMPEIGYLEVHLSHALAEIGNEVHVFTSSVIPKSFRKITKTDSYQPGVTYPLNNNTLKITRIKPIFHFNHIVLASGLVKQVAHFKPDLIIVSGVTKLFPYFIINKLNTSVPIYAFVGKNAYQKRNKNSIYKYFLNEVFKKFVLSNAIKKCKRILIYNDGATKMRVKESINDNLESVFDDKIKKIKLGFDESKFFFSQNERKELRLSLGIHDETIVFITTTRVEPSKHLEIIVDAISKCKNNEILLIIIGFQNDNYERSFKKYIEDTKIKFIGFPFLDHDQVRKITSASDIGIWTQPSISIMEAMGTGIKVLLEDHDSTRYLIDDHDGWLYNKSNLSDAINLVIDQIKNFNEVERKELSLNHTKNFSFISLAKEIVKTFNK